ncbi:MAG TPA: M23 family metallopeptidase [Solirubrobacter sp.]|nr:M23 family metallopeptidase [Solirubrobacter sp.]
MKTQAAEPEQSPSPVLEPVTTALVAPLPGALTPQVVTALQATAGNAAVSRMILSRQEQGGEGDECAGADQARAPSLVAAGREQPGRTFGQRLTAQERSVWRGLTDSCQRSFGSCTPAEQARIAALPEGGGSEERAVTPAAKHERLRRLHGRIHAAMDVAAERDTAVFAPLAGLVTMSRRQGTYGEHVAILHQCPPETEEFGSAPVLTVYAHLSARDVATGDLVAAGQQIGRVGDTGVEGRVHLHFAVRHLSRRHGPEAVTSAAEEDRQVRINPRDWLRAIGVSVGPAEVRDAEAAPGRGREPARQIQRFPLGEDARRRSGAEREHVPRRGGTLPYRESQELADCTRILGPEAADECRDLILGPRPPGRRPLTEEEWEELRALPRAQRLQRLSQLVSPRSTMSGTGGWMEYNDSNRERFDQYFAARLAPLGLTPDDLLVYSSDLTQANPTYRELPPPDLWPNMAQTLQLLQLIAGASGVSFTILSAYRSDVVNPLSAGTRHSAHEDFYGLDVQPSNQHHFHAFIKHFWWERGIQHRMGLGFYSEARVHVDARSRRRWEWEDTAAQSRARYTAVYGNAALP